MSPMRAELSPTEREKLLRDLWVAHDGRWFLTVAAEFGFDVANKLNQAVLRSMGKKEARELMTRTGTQIEHANDVKKFMEMAGPIYWPEAHVYDIGDPHDNMMTGHVIHCYVWDNVSKASGTSLYKCAAPLRFRAWLEGLGVPGEVIATKECDTCNGSCDISFRFDLPVEAVRGK
jgi:hypothetical protein